MQNHHDDFDAGKARPGKSGLLRKGVYPSGTRAVNTTLYGLSQWPRTLPRRLPKEAPTHVK
jgi:hypothetical protein